MPEPVRPGAGALHPVAAESHGKAFELPRYPRNCTRRICHIGVGSFHRAHQAWALHRLLQEGHAEGWGICGIGLRPADRPLLEQLKAQNGLYALVQADESGSQLAIVGSLMELVDASRNSSAALGVLCEPATSIVSFTITEAAYCLGADGAFDLAHPDIAADLEHPRAPRTAQGLVVEALRQRREAGHGGFTLMSCDNLIGNGHRLHAGVLGYAERLDPTLAQWIETNTSFPLSMVDRITPALDDHRRAALCAEWGIADAAPVLCEPWFQWILEDRFVAGRPPFEKAGVTFSHDVAAYEDVKVGLLNGTHSALAHLGLMSGNAGVSEALQDATIAGWARSYMNEVAVTLHPPAGFDLPAYQLTTLRRFANPVIGDRLQRLAQDTSMKFRQALLPRLDVSVAAGQPIACMSSALALWIVYLASLAGGVDGRTAYQDVERDRLIALAVDACEQIDAGPFLRAAVAPEPPTLAALLPLLRVHLAALKKVSPLDYVRSLLNPETHD